MKEVQAIKKSNLIVGIAYVPAGIMCLTAALLDTKLNSLLCGFAGAGILPGCLRQRGEKSSCRL